jgi:spoIIIJ-associated protein
MPIAVERTGKTVQDAIHEALEALGVTADDESVVIEVLDEGENKLFGRRPAKVRVTLEVAAVAGLVGENDGYVEYEDDYAEEDEGFVPGEITYEGETGTPEEEDAVAFVAKVLAGIGISARISCTRDEETIRVDAACDDCGSVIGRRGETLDAIQYLSSLAVNRAATDRVRVVVDVGGYRRRREEALVKLAERVAEKVVSSGRSSMLESMNPAERRIVHCALQEYEGVVTYSEGEEPNRRVVVAPRED